MKKGGGETICLPSKTKKLLNDYTSQPLKQNAKKNLITSLGCKPSNVNACIKPLKPLPQCLDIDFYNKQLLIISIAEEEINATETNDEVQSILKKLTGILDDEIIAHKLPTEIQDTKNLILNELFKKRNIIESDIKKIEFKIKIPVSIQNQNVNSKKPPISIQNQNVNSKKTKIEPAEELELTLKERNLKQQLKLNTEYTNRFNNLFPRKILRNNFFPNATVHSSATLPNKKSKY
jgi:hypothetical protein